MQTFNHVYIDIPDDMGADFGFSYNGNRIYGLGGVNPGDIICVKMADKARKDGPVVVFVDGERILCNRVKSESKEYYLPLDPFSPQMYDDDQIEFIGDVVGLMRYFPSRTEVQNDGD